MKKSSEKTNPMAKIRDESREDYLEAIYLLSKQYGGFVRSARLAEFMGFSKASISRAVGILKEDGYIFMDADYRVSLTAVGLDEAERIYRKHCYFERQLIEAGVDTETASAEACRLEHAISDNSFEKLLLSRKLASGESEAIDID